MSISTILPLTPTKLHKKSKEKSKKKEKKRKEHPTEVEEENERAKKKSKSKGKERQREAHPSAAPGGEFIQTTSTLALSLPPFYASSPLKGAISVLDGLVMRYIPALQGVLLSHSNARFVQQTASIQDDSPFMKCNVIFECVVWSPTIGMKLSGLHSISSPSHMSILLHRTFNVSIPSSHIPQSKPSKSEVVEEETFQFVFGSSSEGAADEQKVQVESAPQGDDDEIEIDELDQEEPAKEVEEEEKGQWISSLTGYPISGFDGARPIEFTVIGMTIANSMLSLIGSLQPDPFDPRHAQSTPPSPHASQIDVDLEEDERLEVEAEVALELEYPPIIISKEDKEDPEVEGDEVHPTKDLFAELGRHTDAAFEKARKEKKKKNVEGGVDDEGAKKKRKRKEKERDKPDGGGEGDVERRKKSKTISGVEVAVKKEKKKKKKDTA